LSFATDETTLKDAFSEFGNVLEARIIIDRESGRSRGFGFITFTSTEEASAAMTSMDGKELQGRNIRVLIFLAFSNLQLLFAGLLSITEVQEYGPHAPKRWLYIVLIFLVCIFLRTKLSCLNFYILIETVNFIPFRVNNKFFPITTLIFLLQLWFAGLAYILFACL
ncbi:hypothetical protein ACJX0J_032526, partial [Zea mays]